MLSLNWPSPLTMTGVTLGNSFLDKLILLLKLITIIAVCYGLSQNWNSIMWFQELYYGANARSTATIDNSLFGGDTWPLVKKSAVLWYRDVWFGDNGPLVSLRALMRWVQPNGPERQLQKGPLGSLSSSGRRGHRLGRCRLRAVLQLDLAPQQDHFYPPR